MRSSISSVLAMLALTNAQTTTSNLFMYYWQGDIFSVLTATATASDATATTYLLGCSPSEPTENCGPPFTFTEGPSTFSFATTAHDVTQSLDYTMTAQCSLDGTTQAVCTESFGGTEANFPGVSTTTYSSDAFATIPVVGAAATSASASVTSTESASPTSAPTSAVPSRTATSTGTANGVGSTSTSSSSATAASTSASSAAMARITAGPGWVVGAGALAALAAL